MTTPFLKVLNATSQMAQSFQVKQWWLFRCKRLSSRCIASPAGRNGSVVAVEVSNDQVGIRTATNTDDLHLLAAERMRGMSDGHPSPNSWGRWGSVLWGCPPRAIKSCKRSSAPYSNAFTTAQKERIFMKRVMASDQTAVAIRPFAKFAENGPLATGFWREISSPASMRSITAS